MGRHKKFVVVVKEVEVILQCHKIDRWRVTSTRKPLYLGVPENVLLRKIQGILSRKKNKKCTAFVKVVLKDGSEHSVLLERLSRVVSYLGRDATARDLLKTFKLFAGLDDVESAQLHPEILQDESSMKQEAEETTNSSDTGSTAEELERDSANNPNLQDASVDCAGEEEGEDSNGVGESPKDTTSRLLNGNSNQGGGDGESNQKEESGSSSPDGGAGVCEESGSTLTENDRSMSSDYIDSEGNFSSEKSHDKGRDGTVEEGSGENTANSGKSADKDREGINGKEEKSAEGTKKNSANEGKSIDRNRLQKLGRKLFGKTKKPPYKVVMKIPPKGQPKGGKNSSAVYAQYAQAKVINHPVVRTMRNLLKDILSGEEQSHRLDVKKLFTELISKRASLSRIRKEEQEVVRFVFSVDVSGSCSAHAPAFVDVVRTLIEHFPQNVVGIIHSNGIVHEIVRDGKIEVLNPRYHNERHDLREVVASLKGQVRFVIDLGDDDATDDYNEIMKSKVKLLRIHIYGCSIKKPRLEEKQQFMRLFTHGVSLNCIDKILHYPGIKSWLMGT